MKTKHDFKLIIKRLKDFSNTTINKIGSFFGLKKYDIVKKVIRVTLWIPATLTLLFVGAAYLIVLSQSVTNIDIGGFKWVISMALLILNMGLVTALMISISTPDSNQIEDSELKQQKQTARRYIINLINVTIFLWLFLFTFKSIIINHNISEAATSMLMLISVIVSIELDTFARKVRSYIGTSPVLGSALAAAIIGVFGTIIATILTLAFSK